jgi:isoquinoline 1-oxidoreductase subunit alpha
MLPTAATTSADFRSDAGEIRPICTDLPYSTDPLTYHFIRRQRRCLHRARVGIRCKTMAALNHMLESCMEGITLAHFQLLINGHERPVNAEPAMPLLWVLRDILNLTGTKYGCGIGMCGACTVHLDRQAARSCQIPLSSVGTKAITTIEGLSADRSHPVQRAWLEEQVPQCGYCQSGQIMQAAALLAKTPHPTRLEVDRAMSGNICRCATYQRIRRAIESAAGGKA